MILPHFPFKRTSLVVSGLAADDVGGLAADDVGGLAADDVGGLAADDVGGLAVHEEGLEVVDKCGCCLPARSSITNAHMPLITTSSI